MRVLEDDLFTLDDSEESAIPGYLVLRVKAVGATLAGLDATVASRLGGMLATAARAITGAVAAERVYCLSFCELDPRLHFHLFPRTRWLLDAYQQGTGTAGEPVNGPAMFEWARRAFPAGAALPTTAAPDAATARARLRAALAG
jgi:diadenosine tetraphosphate (Ap4A) HIT family hydrolase